MPSQEEIDNVRARLEEAGISSSNSRSHQALAAFSGGMVAEDCIADALKKEASAREMWLKVALDPWCKRHGISRKQALSIVFSDHTYNPIDPSKDNIVLKDLFAWGGQQNDFASYFRRNPDALTSGEQKHKVIVCVEGGTVQYATSNSVDIDLVIHDLDKLRERGVSSEAATILLDSVALGCSELAFGHSFEHDERQANHLAQDLNADGTQNSKDPGSAHRHLYVQTLLASPSHCAQLLDCYASMHEKVNETESIGQYIKRCAEQDFEDGESGCLFPLMYRETLATSQAVTLDIGEPHATPGEPPKG